MRDMLYEAVHWAPESPEPKPPRDELLAVPELARYLENWGRSGDAVAVALDEAGSRIGAAWYRLMPAEAPGYGFVDARTPEVAMAVAPRHRGRGVGEALLRSLMDTARSQSFGALCLSVQRTNPTAAKLYGRCGFQEVSRVGDDLTMKVNLTGDETGTRPKHSLTLTALEERLAICRLSSKAEVPAWATASPFFSISRTPDELSIVCKARQVPHGTQAERGWRALKLEGSFDLSLRGILASIIDPLAQAGIGIFAISTYDTDYVLLRDERLENATAVLTRHGHKVHLTSDKLTNVK